MLWSHFGTITKSTDYYYFFKKIRQNVDSYALCLHSTHWLHMTSLNTRKNVVFSSVDKNHMNHLARSTCCFSWLYFANINKLHCRFHHIKWIIFNILYVAPKKFHLKKHFVAFSFSYVLQKRLSANFNVNALEYF